MSDKLKRYISKYLGSISSLDVDISEEQIEKICIYILTLSKWTKKTNLIGISTPEQIFEELIVDSIHLAELFFKDNRSSSQSFLDIGAGAGIPGIAFRILYPHGEYLMVEPRKKRNVFVNLMINTLKLKKTTLFPYRIEELSETHQFDICLSRAFCPWRKFLNICRPYLKEKGHVIVFSNSPWQEDNLPEDFKFLKQHPYISVNKKRYLWVFSKRSI